MFDKKYISIEGHRQPHYPQKIDVHEHRAPTDDSIRIYDEIKSKTEKNILDTIYIKDNIFSGAVIFYQPDIGCDYHRLHFKFTLNGEEFIGAATVDKDVIRDEFLNRRTHAIKVLLKEVCIQIAATLAAKITELVDEPITGIMR